jgi:hypothetical protein
MDRTRSAPATLAAPAPLAAASQLPRYAPHPGLAAAPVPPSLSPPHSQLPGWAPARPQPQLNLQMHQRQHSCSGLASWPPRSDASFPSADSAAATSTAVAPPPPLSPPAVGLGEPSAASSHSLGSSCGVGAASAPPGATWASLDAGRGRQSAGADVPDLPSLDEALTDADVWDSLLADSGGALAGRQSGRRFLHSPTSGLMAGL